MENIMIRVMQILTPTRGDSSTYDRKTVFEGSLQEFRKRYPKPSRFPSRLFREKPDPFRTFTHDDFRVDYEFLYRKGIQPEAPWVECKDPRR